MSFGWNRHGKYTKHSYTQQITQPFSYNHRLTYSLVSLKTVLDYQELVQRCLANDRKAQKELYAFFSASMFAICLRYAKSKEDAEDIFQQAFIKIFTRLNQISDPKALPGWMKSVFVREALDFYKSQYEKQQFSNIENTEISHFDINEALEKLQTDELRNQINKLPDKARLVFNLYVIDGYNHAEIAQLLQINEGTSKSQLFEAKKRLKYQIKQLNEFVLQTK